MRSAATCCEDAHSSLAIMIGQYALTKNSMQHCGKPLFKIVEAIGEDPQDEGVFKLVECGLLK